MGASGTAGLAGRDGLSVARVLVVEDDPGVRDVIQEALTDEGYCVDVAGGGEAALALLDGPAFRPHVVLLDLRMPGMSGHEFAAAYRRRPGPHALPRRASLGRAALPRP